MRNFRFYLLLALVALTGNVSAQNASTVSQRQVFGVDTEGWNTAWVEYNMGTFKVDVKGADDQSFTGFSLGYSHAFSLSLTTPLFVEVGLGGQYSSYEKEWYEDEEYYDGSGTFRSRRSNGLDLWSIKAPINFLYRYDIPNSLVSLMPFVGVNLRFNVSGKQENYIGYKTLEADVFDDKEMGGSDNTFNRIQLGWHVGMKANFLKHIMVGLSYGTDITEISKKTKINALTITAGYIF